MFLCLANCSNPVTALRVVCAMSTQTRNSPSIVFVICGGFYTVYIYVYVLLLTIHFDSILDDRNGPVLPS